MGLKAILFDFDGTVINTESAEFATWQEVYRSYGRELPLKRWAQIVGSSADAFDPLTHLELLLGRSLPRQEILTARSARDRGLTDAMDARPGVRELIRQARGAGVRLAIASSSPRAWIEHHLGRLQLLSAFDAIASFDEAGKGKPDPAVFLCALEMLGVRAGEAIAIEDSPNGVIAARRAGIACLVVPNDVTAQMEFPPFAPSRSSLEGVTLDDLQALVPAAEAD